MLNIAEVLIFIEIKDSFKPTFELYKETINVLFIQLNIKIGISVFIVLFSERYLKCNFKAFNLDILYEASQAIQ